MTMNVKVRFGLAAAWLLSNALAHAAGTPVLSASVKLTDLSYKAERLGLRIGSALTIHPDSIQPPDGSVVLTRSDASHRNITKEAYSLHSLPFIDSTGSYSTSLGGVQVDTVAAGQSLVMSSTADVSAINGMFTALPDGLGAKYIAAAHLSSSEAWPVGDDRRMVTLAPYSKLTISGEYELTTQLDVAALSMTLLNDYVSRHPDHSVSLGALAHLSMDFLPGPHDRYLHEFIQGNPGRMTVESLYGVSPGHVGGGNGDDIARQRFTMTITNNTANPLSGSFLYNANVNTQAIVYQIPEPGTWALGLLGLAFGGIVLGRRKRLAAKAI